MSSADIIPVPSPEAPSPDKRAYATSERLELVAKILQEENNMEEFGIILRTTGKGHFVKGSTEAIEKFRKILNTSNDPVLKGCNVGFIALKSWIQTIRSKGLEEAERRLQKRTVDGIERYIIASYELMEKFKKKAGSVDS